MSQGPARKYNVLVKDKWNSSKLIWEECAESSIQIINYNLLSGNCRDIESELAQTCT